MSIKVLFEACIVLLTKQPKGSKIHTTNGVIDQSEALREMKKLLGWCFPGLNSEQFEKVIHCSDCVHYKKYHKKAAPKKDCKMLCALDKKARRPQFFCGDAKEKE